MDEQIQAMDRVEVRMACVFVVLVSEVANSFGTTPMEKR